MLLRYRATFLPTTPRECGPALRVSLITKEETLNAPETHLFLILSTLFMLALKPLTPLLALDKAAGPDNIPGRVLKDGAHQLSEVLIDIFKISL